MFLDLIPSGIYFKAILKDYICYQAFCGYINFC